MTSTGDLLTDILALYLPLALALIMGVIGLFRGARREAVVSFSIVLAALVIYGLGSLARATSMT